MSAKNAGTARAPARVAAGDRRLHGRARRALDRREHQQGDAHLRRGVPRRLPRRPPLHPRAAAVRRPVHVPARGAAGRVRAGRDLPDRPEPGVEAGHAVRRRPRAASCATVLFLRDYRSLERYRYTIAIAGIVLLLAPRLPGIGRATNGAYLSIGVGSFAFQPAEFAKIAIVIFLASYLNDVRDVLVRGRVPRDQPQAPRPAARDLGHGDADARLHPRPRQLGDVLRRLPGAALRRHQPAVARAPGPRAVPRRRGVPREPRRRTCTSASQAWLHPFTPASLQQGRRQLPDRAVALRAGRRRAVRPRLRAGAAHAGGPRRQAGADRAGRADRPDLRGDRERGRAVRRRRDPASSGCCSPRAGSRPRRSPPTASRSCSRPASRRCSRSRCS